MAPPRKRSKVLSSSEGPAETSLSSAGDATYGLNDVIFCKYGPKSYEAKIIAITNKNGRPSYEIHYQGWNKRYDEVITEEDSKNRFSKFAPVKEESKKAAGSAKTERKVKTNGATNVSIPETSKFDSLIDEDLAFILCEENEKITKNQLLPIVPAQLNIEQIIVKFLESKSIAVNDQGTKLFENSAIVPQNSDNDEVMGSFLTLFNHVFSRLLVYEEEKEIFKNFIKEENNGSTLAYHRYSKSLGLTYLLRFISRLSSILTNNSIWNEDALKYFNQGVSELSSFLTANINNFYSEDEYYKPQKGINTRS